MAFEAETAAPLRALQREAHSTARRAQALRGRLEEFLVMSEEENELIRGQAAVLAEAILGSAAAQKMVELTRWVERHLEFIRTLWPIAYFHSQTEALSLNQTVTNPWSPWDPEAALPLLRSWVEPDAPMEYESTTAEDEEGAEADADVVWDDEGHESLAVGVNLYLYMEDDLAAAAEGLVSMPKLANAIAEGLVACRGVNMAFCGVVAAHRETARLLLSMGEDSASGEPDPAAGVEAIQVQALRALEAAAVDVCDAVRSVLRAVQRGVALMQTAMDGVETSAAAKRRSKANADASGAAAAAATAAAAAAAVDINNNIIDVDAEVIVDNQFI